MSKLFCNLTFSSAIAFLSVQVIYFNDLKGGDYKAINYSFPHRQPMQDWKTLQKMEIMILEMNLLQKQDIVLH